MLADAYFLTATVHQFSGNFDSAIADAQEILRLSQAIGHVWTQIVGHFYAGTSLAEQGEYERAYDNFQDGLQLAQKAGIIAYQDIAAGHLIALYLASGAFELAAPLAEELHQNRDRLVFSFDSVILTRIALLKLAMGDVQQAERIIAEAYPDPNRGDPTFYAVSASRRAEGYLCLAQDRPQQALAKAGDLAGRVRRIGAFAYLPEALLIQGKALAALDNLDQAGAVLHEANAAAEKIGQRRVLWQILAALAKIEEQQGNSAKAKAHRDEARQIVDYIAGHSGSQLRAALLSIPEVKSLLAHNED